MLEQIRDPLTDFGLPMPENVAARRAHGRLDRFRLRPTERALFAAVETRIARRFPGFLARSRERSRLVAGAYYTPGDFRVAFPRTVDEKYAWRKIFDHDPRFTVLSDKIRAKDWMARHVPELSIAPIRWQGTDPAAIPQQMVDRPGMLKGAHGCGLNHLIFPGATTLADLRELGRRYMARRHGERMMQWGYFHVPSALLIEDMLAWAGPDLEEIKVFIFGGRVDRVTRSIDRRLDPQWQGWQPDAGEVLRFDPELINRMTGRQSARPPPATLARAVEIARKAAAGFDHIRMDMMTDGTDIWFAEVTFYTYGGAYPVFGTDPDALATRHWDLRQSWFLRTRQRDPLKELYRRTLRRALDRAAAEVDAVS